MTKLTYHQRCFGWASGHYLADEVDKTFWELDDDEQLEFLENNAWEPFEDYPGKDEDYEPTDEEMMASFGTKWHDGL